MRKTIAVISATGALLFGGAGVANATAHSATVPASTTTTLADNSNNNNADQHSDKTGLWGLLGLAGLFGLVGLKRRNDTDAGVGVGPAATRGRVA
jgi:MYXO-CTERM domain-containing protein